MGLPSLLKYGALVILLKFFPVFFRFSGRFDGVWCVGSFTHVAPCGPLSIEDPFREWFRTVQLGLTMSWAGADLVGQMGFESPFRAGFGMVKLGRSMSRAKA
ncbi:unnamed protein product [Camellia sinensis]